MHIIVPIKQVPETSNVRMDPETGTMIRSGTQSVLNPLDLYALEAALRLEERFPGGVTVLTMGPPSAEKVLREAIAMGCSRGVLVTDQKFGGSDTWATSYTLSKAIEKIGSYDLIITGERATDGDTGQVGPGIAAWLDLPLATYATALEPVPEAVPSGTVTDAGDQPAALRVDRMIEDGYQILELELPALITVVKEIAEPRLPTLEGKKQSMEAKIDIFNSENLDLEPNNLGLRGSPTRVVKIETPTVARSGDVRMVKDEASLSVAVDDLIRFLGDKNILPEAAK